MPNCLYDIFIYIKDAPATYPDNGIVGLLGWASSKMGLKISRENGLARAGF